MTLTREWRPNPADEARERTDDPRRSRVEERGLAIREAPVPALDSLEDRRVAVTFRNHRYELRHDDVTLLRTVGTFRAIYADDLRAAFHRLERDVRTLREQGLLTATPVHRADTRDSTTVISLTRVGRDLVQAAESGPQRYHGEAVRLRELHHDAQLWRVYQRCLEDIERRGATVQQIRLDHELKQALWKAQAMGQQSPIDPAEALGLPRDANGHVQIPDFQILARESSGAVTRCNVELVTRHYTAATIRGKAAAGFALYDDSTLRGAGDDRDLASRVFDF